MRHKTKRALGRGTFRHVHDCSKTLFIIVGNLQETPEVCRVLSLLTKGQQLSLLFCLLLLRYLTL